MIKNNFYILVDTEKLADTLSLLVIDGYLNLNLIPRTGDNSAWLWKYWGTTHEPIPVEVSGNKISFTTMQELHIGAILAISRVADSVEFYCAGSEIGENTKHITISQQVPTQNAIAINPKEFACLVWGKDYFDYIKKSSKDKNIGLDDIDDLDYSEIEDILAIGGINASF